MLLFLVCGTQAGCVYEKNERLTLGGAYRSPAIFETERPPAGFGHAPGLFEHTPSDRANWATTPFVAPFDGVVHGHLLRVFPANRPGTPARAYGRYPTIADALDPQSHGYTPDLWYTLSEYGRSSLGADYSFLYLLTKGHLFEDMMSPFPYKRTHSTGWSSGRPADTPSEKTDE